MVTGVLLQLDVTLLINDAFAYYLTFYYIYLTIVHDWYTVTIMYRLTPVWNLALLFAWLFKFRAAGRGISF